METLNPITREEQYYAYFSGDTSISLPTPITRKEYYLHYLCTSGVISGATPEQIQASVDNYLDQNPVQAGATAEQAAQIEQNAEGIAELSANKADQTEVDELKRDKLDKPKTPPDAAGKVLRVLSVTDDGTFTCEWADSPSGGVTDVFVDGTSIVQGGVANIPLASKNVKGVSLIDGDNNGITIKSDGSLAFNTISDYFSFRLTNWRINGVHTKNIDLAVKTAMCDGKGAAWTDAERIAALLRMGCTVDENGFVKWTAQEEAAAE